eukprot:scaffold9250_cov21-Tisochrysis_lutea.AAC.1
MNSKALGGAQCAILAQSEPGKMNSKALGGAQCAILALGLNAALASACKECSLPIRAASSMGDGRGLHSIIKSSWTIGCLKCNKSPKQPEGSVLNYSNPACVCIPGETPQLDCKSKTVQLATILMQGLLAQMADKPLPSRIMLHSYGGSPDNVAQVRQSGSACKDRKGRRQQKQILLLTLHEHAKDKDTVLPSRRKAKEKANVLLKNDIIHSCHW